MKRKRQGAFSAVSTGKGIQKRKQQTVGQLVQKAIQRAQDLHGVDLEFLTAALKSTTNTNDDVHIINAVDLKSGNNARTDSSVSGKSIRIKLRVAYAYAHELLTGNIYGNQVRVAIVWDRKPEGLAVPTYDTIFNSISKSGGTVSSFQSNVNPNETDRFQVLRDVVFTFEPVGENRKGLTNDAITLFRS